MLFDWELVKEDVVCEVCKLYPDVPEEHVRKVVDGMKVVVNKVALAVAYKVVE